MNWIAPFILFLLYLNAPAVAVRIHGAPYIVGALIPLALAIPVANRVLIRGESLRFPQVVIAAVVMLLFHALSAFLSIRPSESLDSLETWLIEGVLLALLVANAVRSRADVQAAALAIVAAGATMGAITLAQQLSGGSEAGFFGFGQLDATIVDAGGHLQRRVAGPIGETNRFAQIMSVLIPISGACAICSSGPRRYAFALATLLIAGGMLFAFSRGALLALGLALPLAVPLGLLRTRHLIIAVLASIVVLTALPHYAERVISIGEVAVRAVGFAPGGLRNADGAARGRLTEMKAAGMLFMDRPLLGAGPGLSPHYYSEYAGIVGGKVRPGTRRSHNLFLQLAAETGTIGLAAFVCIIALTFRDLDRARRRLDGNDRALWGIVCGLELALLIFLATSLFLHAAYIRYFWMLIGLSIAASAQQRAPVLAALLDRMFRQTAQRIRADA